MYEIVIKTEFAAAHSLRNYKGACEVIHGHNWKVEVAVRSEGLDEAGLAIDFNLLKEKTLGVIGELDHININDHPAFTEKSPSSENIARHIYERLKRDLPPPVLLHRVTIWETDDASASYFEG